MHVALFGGAAAAATDVGVFAAKAAVVCTTAQLPVLQRNVFLPPAAAIWMTGCAVDVHAQPAPGQLDPA
jgi:hypothetical protein